MTREERLQRNREIYQARREVKLKRMRDRYWAMSPEERRAKRAGWRERARARRRTAVRLEQHAVEHRAVLLAEARAEATGELAVLVAEQEADDHYFVTSVPINEDYRPGVQWDDPTAVEALARLEQGEAA